MVKRIMADIKKLREEAAKRGIGSEANGGTWYHSVSPAVAEWIADSHLGHGEFVEEFIIAMNVLGVAQSEHKPDA